MAAAMSERQIAVTAAYVRQLTVGYDTATENARKIAEERRAVLRELHQMAGLTYVEIGELVNLSAARVGQLINADRPR